MSRVFCSFFCRSNKNRKDLLESSLIRLTILAPLTRHSFLLVQHEHVLLPVGYSSYNRLQSGSDPGEWKMDSKNGFLHEMAYSEHSAHKDIDNT